MNRLLLFARVRQTKAAPKAVPISKEVVVCLAIHEIYFFPLTTIHMHI